MTLTGYPSRRREKWSPIFTVSENQRPIKDFNKTKTIQQEILKDYRNILNVGKILIKTRHPVAKEVINNNNKKISLCLATGNTKLKCEQEN